MPNPKLPFWHTVSLSYTTYLGNFIDVLRASWLWIVLVAVLTGVASSYRWSWMATAMANLKFGPGQLSRPFEVGLLVDLDTVFFLLAGVSIAVAWHRLMIIDEHPAFSGSNVVSSSFWRYAIMGLVLFLMTFLPVAGIWLPAFYFLLPKPGTSPPSPVPFLLVPVAIILCVTINVAVVRLWLLLPAQAIGNTSLTFKQAWNRTRGNVWRLVWGVAATTLPMVVIHIILLLRFGLPHLGRLEADFVSRMTAGSILGTACDLLILPISIGFLSHAYRHFFEPPLESATSHNIASPLNS